MVELKDFVSKTISDILEGVADVHNNIGGLSATVNPPLKRSNSKYYRVSHIEFDVSVTTSETSTTNKGLGVFVVGLGAGAKEGSGVEQAATSRVKFSVPIIYPRFHLSETTDAEE